MIVRTLKIIPVPLLLLIIGCVASAIVKGVKSDLSLMFWLHISMSLFTALWSWAKYYYIQEFTDYKSTPLSVITTTIIVIAGVVVISLSGHKEWSLAIAVFHILGITKNIEYLRYLQEDISLQRISKHSSELVRLVITQQRNTIPRDVMLSAWWGVYLYHATKCNDDRAILLFGGVYLIVIVMLTWNTLKLVTKR